LQQYGEPVSPAALVDHQCLYYPRGVELPRWTFQSEDCEAPPAATVTVTVSGAFATNNSESIRDAALAGMGIALLPDFSAYSALREGHLIQILPAWSSVGAFAENLYIVRPWTSQVPRAVSLFTAYLRQAFNENLKNGFAQQPLV